MDKIYCGNNILNADTKGTRYQCLKKGIGIGMNSDDFELYLSKNKTRNKIYCGNSSELPPDYNRFGSTIECISRGFGVGKGIAFKKNLDNLISNINELIK